jgi:hypothetical protein
MTRKFWIALTLITLTAGVGAYFHLRKKIGEDIDSSFDIHWEEL